MIWLGENSKELQLTSMMSSSLLIEEGKEEKRVKKVKDDDVVIKKHKTEGTKKKGDISGIYKRYLPPSIEIKETSGLSPLQPCSVL